MGQTCVELVLCAVERRGHHRDGKPRALRCASLVRELARCEVTSFCAPPTVWRAIIQLPLDDIKMSLRELASAGEPLNPEVIARVRNSCGLTIRAGSGRAKPPR